MNFELFVKIIEENHLNVEGVLVHRDGKEIACHRWVEEAPRAIYSVSKGFASIAVGMAISEGKLRLSDRVTRFFPQAKANARWDSLTLEHLLTMTMGHAHFSRPQSLQEAFSYELESDPGTCFVYDNTCTFLASAMLTKATGLKLREYLQERLFSPLKMGEPEWQESSDGYTIGATGLMLTTSELSLFARFLLQRGNWEGKSLLPASWIDAATRTQVPTNPPETDRDWDLGYGYQFWTCRHGAYRLDGREGQFIIVLPFYNTVITINSNEADYKHILWAVWDGILPLLKN